MFIPHIHPGFHRVYRRLLEANHRLVSAPEDRKIIQDNIKLAMRFPTKYVYRDDDDWLTYLPTLPTPSTYLPIPLSTSFLGFRRVVEVMEESHTIAFLQKYANEIVSDVEAKAPPFFAAAGRWGRESQVDR